MLKSIVVGTYRQFMLVCADVRREKDSSLAIQISQVFVNPDLGHFEVRESGGLACPINVRLVKALLHQNMFHMTTTTGEKTFQTSDKSSNGRVQHVRMYGGYFSADRIFQFRQT
ncbi:hypothetical protein TNCV_2047361 [Trichonephila clavipes]|uniref:Uncharacterized protein n=1 Tax=Trichonephila clavipes TaxID=2585209 RepID=A0A8X6SVU4_TRICX|nr:hypothetical protein TNCV_2047361 [Trichonephila clavipes]